MHSSIIRSWCRGNTFALLFVRQHVWELGLDIGNRQMNLRALIQQTCNLIFYLLALFSWNNFENCTPQCFCNDYKCKMIILWPIISVVTSLMTSFTYNSSTRTNGHHVCSFGTFKIWYSKHDSFSLKEYKPLWSLPQKSNMAAKERYVGQNLKFDLQSESYCSILAIIHFYHA